MKEQRMTLAEINTQTPFTFDEFYTDTPFVKKRKLTNELYWVGPQNKPNQGFEAHKDRKITPCNANK